MRHEILLEQPYACLGLLACSQMFEHAISIHIEGSYWRICVVKFNLYHYLNGCGWEFQLHLKVCNPNLPGLTPRKQTPETLLLSVFLATFHGAVRYRGAVEEREILNREVSVTCSGEADVSTPSPWGGLKLL